MLKRFAAGLLGILLGLAVGSSTATAQIVMRIPPECVPVEFSGSGSICPVDGSLLATSSIFEFANVTKPACTLHFSVCEVECDGRHIRPKEVQCFCVPLPPCGGNTTAPRTFSFTQTEELKTCDAYLLRLIGPCSCISGEGNVTSGRHCSFFFTVGSDGDVLLGNTTDPSHTFNFTFGTPDPNGSVTINAKPGGAPEVDATNAAAPFAVLMAVVLLVADKRTRDSARS